MGLTAEAIAQGLDAIAAREPLMAGALTRVGYPEARIRPRGATTLLRTIVGQQVSVAAAASVWAKLEALLGEGCPAQPLLSASEEALRACGLSRQAGASLLGAARRGAHWATSCLLTSTRRWTEGRN